MDKWSALSILTDWCFTTRALVATTMLSTHPYILSCLWVNTIKSHKLQRPITGNNSVSSELQCNQVLLTHWPLGDAAVILNSLHSNSIE